MLTDTFDIGITLEQINYFLQSVIYVNIDVDILTEICAQEVQSNPLAKSLLLTLTRFLQRNSPGNSRAVSLLLILFFV